MAISHVQPLLCLLFASLFFSPVLCAIKFEYCRDGSPYQFGNITSVVMKSTGDDTTIIVSGKVNKEADKGLKEGSVSVILGEGGPDDDERTVYDLDKVADAVPIKLGSNFALTLTHVPLQVDNMRYDKVTVILYDEDEVYDQTGVSFEILCISFNPHSSKTSSALSE